MSLSTQEYATFKLSLAYTIWKTEFQKSTLSLIFFFKAIIKSDNVFIVFQLPTLLLLDLFPQKRRNKIFGMLLPFNHLHPQSDFNFLIIKEIHGHFKTFGGKKEKSMISLFRQVLQFDFFLNFLNIYLKNCNGDHSVVYF